MKSRTRTRWELIIAVWEELDCESVGATELEQIHGALTEELGAGAALSPAAIARIVADEGAVLRHPEVFECDLKWREASLQQSGLSARLNFSDLSSAFASVVKIEEKRMEIHGGSGEKGKGERGSRANDDAELKDLREIVRAAREESLLRTRSKILDEEQRRQAKEISDWLSVWLRAPELFSDWLDLRRRSAEFRKKFPE